jgi:hypothetical protein
VGQDGKQAVNQTHFRDLLLALSLANLLFLKAWIEIFEGVRHPYFRADARFYWIDCAAVVLNVLLAGGLFWTGVMLARRSGRLWALRLARGGFLVVFLLTFFIVLNVLRRRFPVLSLDSLKDTLGAPLLILLGLGLLALLIRTRAHLVTAAMLVVLIFSPFALITFGQAVWLGVRHSSPSSSGEAAVRRPPTGRAQTSSRVLWFIFDGMDFRLAFPERPSRIDMPEFDRLRNQTLFATQVVPPAGFTGRSLPGLLTGRRVALARPASRNELVLTYEDDGSSAGWSTQPTVFSLARDAGYTTGVVGWYHPYCRLFESSLTFCSWEPFNAPEATYPIAKSMLEFVRMTAPPFMRGFFDRLGIKDPDLNVQYHIESYLRILNTARETIVDEDLNLVLIHLPVPHPPFIYNRHQQELTLTADPDEGYLDNLVLADLALGDLRSTLEAAGQWDSSAILVSADHPWRDSKNFDGKRDPRVPFMLKLPDQDEGLAFNSLLTGELLLALLRGEVSAAPEAAEWIDRRSVSLPGHALKD